MEPEGGQDTQLQELKESEKEAIIEMFREWRVYEAAVVHYAEDDDDDVEQKMKRHTSPYAHFFSALVSHCTCDCSRHFGSRAKWLKMSTRCLCVPFSKTFSCARHVIDR